MNATMMIWKGRGSIMFQRTSIRHLPNRANLPLLMAMQLQLLHPQLLGADTYSPCSSSLWFRSMATSAPKSKKKKDKGESEETTEPSLSYFDRKASLKQQRAQDYRRQLERRIQQQRRRDHAPKNVLKEEFRSWWDTRVAFEEKMDRKARQAQLPWQIQVAAVVERLPVVIPDKMEFEREFEDLQAYLSSHRGKEYPKEFMGTVSSGSERPVALTDEELIGEYSSMVIKTECSDG
jgi:hypothetical protein